MSAVHSPSYLRGDF